MNTQEQVAFTRSTNAKHVFPGAVSDIIDTRTNPRSTDERVPAAAMYIRAGAQPVSDKDTLRLLTEHPGVLHTERSNKAPHVLTVRFNRQQTNGHNIMSTLRKLGYQRTCIALLYFKGSDLTDPETDIVHALGAQTGVIAAERSAHKAYVLMVHFDPRLTQASNIVRVLRSRGFRVVLAGC